ncbi:MAG TPA: FecR domain-containing protein [Sphingomicrobium sp.]|nr:FecR domain-containing protein [Sphingomicrobium sp.]
MSPEPMSVEMTREEQAGDWCVRLASNTMSREDEAQFDAWLAGDPANSACFDKALKVWHSLHAVADSPEMIGRRADALEALRRANRERWSRKVANRLRWPLAMAASFALVLVSSLLVLVDGPDSYETAIGERRTFVLADGSRMSLDAATKVAVDYESNHRELVLLAGRAKFDVVKDSSRPFTVTAGDRTVVATGTAFSVEMLKENVHVIVYEGRVAVVKDRKPPIGELRNLTSSATPSIAELTPGRELVAARDGPQVQFAQADVARTLAWEGGQLNFVDEPLSSAVERLNRYEERKLVIGDRRAAAIPINGVFNAGDSEAFVDALTTAFPVQVRQRGAEIVLSTSG